MYTCFVKPLRLSYLACILLHVTHHDVHSNLNINSNIKIITLCVEKDDPACRPIIVHVCHAEPTQDHAKDTSTHNHDHKLFHNHNTFTNFTCNE